MLCTQNIHSIYIYIYAQQAWLGCVLGWVYVKRCCVDDMPQYLLCFVPLLEYKICTG